MASGATQALEEKRLSAESYTQTSPVASVKHRAEETDTSRNSDGGRQRQSGGEDSLSQHYEVPERLAEGGETAAGDSSFTSLPSLTEEMYENIPTSTL